MSDDNPNNDGNDNYRPVACALHSEYELLAMHRTPVRLVLTDNSQLEGKVIDLVTRDGAEYLLLEPLSSAQESPSIRLDQIVSCSPLQQR